ncbi:hypothetical protein [Kitasatospora griseola]|uniref:hypothetical protein n=1 Tax=Kitasatospora griseola TaxID=2064 RepID=UPI003816B94A
MTTEHALPALTLAPIDVDDAELLHAWWSVPVAAHERGRWPRPLSAIRDAVLGALTGRQPGGRLRCVSYCDSA